MCKCLMMLALAAAFPRSGDAAPRRFALLGDSMTWIGGDSCQNSNGWSHWLKASGCADNIEVYARSGATWTNTIHTICDTAFYSEQLHDDNVIYNQAVRLTERIMDGTSPHPDVIIIFAGANDCWFADRRPGIFTLSDSVKTFSETALPSIAVSLQQSVMLVCDILKASLPDSDIVLVTPIEMSKVGPDVTRHVSNIIESAGRSRGVRTLRADREVDIRHVIESRKATFTYDGVHTNADGGRLIADFILNAINE